MQKEASSVTVNPIHADSNFAVLSPTDKEILRLSELLARELLKKSTEVEAAAAKRSSALTTATPPAGSSCFQTLAFRAKRSNLAKFINGTDLNPQDADSAVNTMALVGALLLTIPFSLFGSLNQEYWDNLETELAKCDPPAPAGTSAEAEFMAVFNSLTALVYFSMGTILMSVFYYVMRPAEKEELGLWWKRGRYGVALVFIFAVSAVVCSFTVFNVLVAAQWFMGFTSDLCKIAHSSGTPFHRYMSAVCGGMVTIIVLIVLSTFFMI